MKIELPRKVVLIIKNLQRHGYDAYAVGGCVRDSILNRKPEDWDITTSAKPEQVKRIFRRTVDVYKRQPFEQCGKFRLCKSDLHRSG